MMQIADALAERLALLDPSGAERYRRNAAAFGAKVQQRMVDWQQQLDGAPGVVLYHRDAIYLLDRFNVPLLGTIEEVPGVPPSGRQLKQLASQLGNLQGGNGIILFAPYQSPKAPRKLAADTRLAGTATAAGAARRRRRRRLAAPHRPLGRRHRDRPMSAVVDGTLLHVHDLVVGYDRPVVGPLSFSVARGEVLGLWGANGAGKSTLLHAIADGARCFQGRIERAPGLRLAYQEQQPASLQALPLTGNELLRVAGAAQHDLPASLAAIVGKRIDRLSGGQYQLLRVWAALAGGADLLLLDEPTNNLDPSHEELLTDMLRTRTADCAVLLVSHERTFVDATCSRVVQVG